MKLFIGVTSKCVFLFLLVIANLSAQWSTNPNVNNAICTNTGSQSIPTIVSDGAEGAIIAWSDMRNGNSDIYAQRINATGNALWTINGIAICKELNTQAFQIIISDSRGGAIIAWLDYRAGEYDIYAQRINATGVVQWTDNGVPICTTPGTVGYPTIVGDGTGGAIITWSDLRGANVDIYAQRIDSSGAIQWTANGIKICTATSDQDFPVLAEDGTGGAIIAWYDHRSGTNYDIYAQRVNTSGAIQWDTNGVSICTNSFNQTSPIIVSDGAGNAIISWYDYRPGAQYIYAQRINALGAPLWNADGVIVQASFGAQSTPMMVNDDSGGAIITWQDKRNGNYDIFMSHINSSGIVMGNSSISIAAGAQQHPTIVSDGTGGAIIAWQDSSNGTNDVYAQRVHASGTILWTVNGTIISNAASGQFSPMIVSDGTGGAIVTWYDTRNGNNDIYTQRIDRLGNLYPAPWIDKVDDIANDQGGKLRIFWKPSSLDIWGNTSVKSYTIKIGARTTGILGKGSQFNSSDIYWHTAGSVTADWSEGYTAVVSTYADSGFQGVPYYFFRIIAKNADSTVYWSSNIDSAYSRDNIPPGGVSGTLIAVSSNGRVILQWDKNKVDPDLMGYQIYRAVQSGFSMDATTKLAFTFESTYTDTATNGGTHYFYRIAAIDIHGNQGTASAELQATVLAVGDGNNEIPKTFGLMQNYPNPFNPATVINYQLPVNSYVTLKVYDEIGREVVMLVNEVKEAGAYSVQFDASHLFSGMYFARLQSGDKVQLKKMLLIK